MEVLVHSRAGKKPRFFRKSFFRCFRLQCTKYDWTQNFHPGRTSYTFRAFSV